MRKALLIALPLVAMAAAYVAVTWLVNDFNEQLQASLS